MSVAADSSPSPSLQRNISAIESLPVELKLILLGHLDWPASKALARASPTYWTLYIVDRSRFLHSHLHSLDTVLENAVDSLNLLRPPSTDELVQCSDWQHAPNPPLETKWYFGGELKPVQHNDLSMSVRQALRVLHIHHACVQPLAWAYGQWALSNFEELAATEPASLGPHHENRLTREQRQSPTESEVLRITKALYTLYILGWAVRDQSRLCPACDSDHDHRYNADDDVAVARSRPIGMIWRRGFAPWEEETMRCVSLYLGAITSKEKEEVFRETCTMCALEPWRRRSSALWALDDIRMQEYAKNGWNWAGLPEPGIWSLLDPKFHGKIRNHAPRELRERWMKMGYVIWDTARISDWSDRVGDAQLLKMGFNPHWEE